MTLTLPLLEGLAIHSLYQAKQHKPKHLSHFTQIFWHIAAHSGNPLQTCKLPLTFQKIEKKKRKDPISKNHAAKQVER